MRGTICTRKNALGKSAFLKLSHKNQYFMSARKTFFPILFLLQLNIKKPPKNPPNNQKKPQKCAYAIYLMIYLHCFFDRQHFKTAGYFLGLSNINKYQ